MSLATRAAMFKRGIYVPGMRQEEEEEEEAGRRRRRFVWFDETSKNVKNVGLSLVPFFTTKSLFVSP